MDHLLLGANTPAVILQSKLRASGEQSPCLELCYVCTDLHAAALLEGERDEALRA
jgi:hypothetical protein